MRVAVRHEKEAPFIERIFTVNGSPLACRFFQPEADGRDWACRTEIDWPQAPRKRRIMGVDPVQALLLAMAMVHCDLLTAREDLGWDVRWLDDTSLGLPLTPNLRDLDPQGWL
ncbi:hypothetical protein GTZ99_13640 [Novosphingobium sp. FSY-8]|uniref:DUF6968 domain-containing protein n=1 Tax=Novosphingobium ovatum TaxID=1908523 RepID=A0ABW9XGP8_9SPHN|nr:hypothetical protein [Novosphingobium ovatum]NBC37592.1 hypothetical protein [Novosphingobium ovatum]